MNREERSVEIDLLQLGWTLLEKLKYILLTTVIFALVGFAISEFLMTPVYEASAKMIVNTRKDENQNITNDQLNSAKALVDTYAVIIKSRDVLNQVIADLGLEDSYSQLNGNISIKAVNNTQIMKITVRHTDPATAHAVAKKILEIAPEVIVKTVEVGSVKPVEQASLVSDPISPSVTRYTMLMAVLGLILSCGVIIVVFVVDNSYKTDIDLQNDLDLPVLGVIPAVEESENHSKRKKSKKGEKV